MNKGFKALILLVFSVLVLVGLVWAADFAPAQDPNRGLGSDFTQGNESGGDNVSGLHILASRLLLSKDLTPLITYKAGDSKSVEVQLDLKGGDLDHLDLDASGLNSFVNPALFKVSLSRSNCNLVNGTLRCTTQSSFQLRTLQKVLTFPVTVVERLEDDSLHSSGGSVQVTLPIPEANASNESNKTLAAPVIASNLRLLRNGQPVQYVSSKYPRLADIFFDLSGPVKTATVTAPRLIPYTTTLDATCSTAPNGTVCSLKDRLIMPKEASGPFQINTTNADGVVSGTELQYSVTLDDTSPELVSITTPICQGEMCYLKPGTPTNITVVLQDLVGTLDQRLVAFQIGGGVAQLVDNCSGFTCVGVFKGSCSGKVQANIASFKGVPSQDDAGNPVIGKPFPIVCDGSAPVAGEIKLSIGEGGTGETASASSSGPVVNVSSDKDFIVLNDLVTITAVVEDDTPVTLSADLSEVSGGTASTALSSASSSDRSPVSSQPGFTPVNSFGKAATPSFVSAENPVEASDATPANNAVQVQCQANGTRKQVCTLSFTNTNPGPLRTSLPLKFTDILGNTAVKSVELVILRTEEEKAPNNFKVEKMDYSPKRVNSKTLLLFNKRILTNVKLGLNNPKAKVMSLEAKSCGVGDDNSSQVFLTVEKVSQSNDSLNIVSQVFLPRTLNANVSNLTISCDLAITSRDDRVLYKKEEIKTYSFSLEFYDSATLDFKVQEEIDRVQNGSLDEIRKTLKVLGTVNNYAQIGCKVVNLLQTINTVFSGADSVLGSIPWTQPAGQAFGKASGGLGNVAEGIQNLGVGKVCRFLQCDSEINRAVTKYLEKLPGMNLVNKAASTFVSPPKGGPSNPSPPPPTPPPQAAPTPAAGRVIASKSMNTGFDFLDYSMKSKSTLSGHSVAEQGRMTGYYDIKNIEKDTQGHAYFKPEFRRNFMTISPSRLDDVLKIYRREILVLQQEEKAISPEQKLSLYKQLDELKTTFNGIQQEEFNVLSEKGGIPMQLTPAEYITASDSQPLKGGGNWIPVQIQGQTQYVQVSKERMDDYVKKVNALNEKKSSTPSEPAKSDVKPAVAEAVPAVVPAEAVSNVKPDVKPAAEPAVVPAARGCTPQCAGPVKCGVSDGCGGTCTGSCDSGETCTGGTCVSSDGKSKTAEEKAISTSAKTSCSSDSDCKDGARCNLDSHNCAASGASEVQSDNEGSPKPDAPPPFLAFYRPENSLIVSAVSLCIPGIVYNLEKYTTIDCEYIRCLKQDVPAGLPPQECQRDQSYQKCKFVVGEVFNAIPYTAVYQGMVTEVQHILSNPYALATFLMTYLHPCDALVSSPATGFCRLPQLFKFVQKALNLWRNIRSVGNQFKDLKDNSFKDPDAFCAGVLKMKVPAALELPPDIRDPSFRGWIPNVGNANGDGTVTTPSGGTMQIKNVNRVALYRDSDGQAHALIDGKEIKLNEETTKLANDRLGRRANDFMIRSKGGADNKFIDDLVKTSAPDQKMIVLVGNQAYYTTREDLSSGKTQAAIDLRTGPARLAAARKALEDATRSRDQKKIDQATNNLAALTQQQEALKKDANARANAQTQAAGDRVVQSQNVLEQAQKALAAAKARQTTSASTIQSIGNEINSKKAMLDDTTPPPTSPQKAQLEREIAGLQARLDSENKAESEADSAAEQANQAVLSAQGNNQKQKDAQSKAEENAKKIVAGGLDSASHFSYAQFRAAMSLAREAYYTSSISFPNFDWWGYTSYVDKYFNNAVFNLQGYAESKICMDSRGTFKRGSMGSQAVLVRDPALNVIIPGAHVEGDGNEEAQNGTQPLTYDYVITAGVKIFKGSGLSFSVSAYSGSQEKSLQSVQLNASPSSWVAAGPSALKFSSPQVFDKVCIKFNGNLKDFFDEVRVDNQNRLCNFISIQGIPKPGQFLK